MFTKMELRKGINDSVKDDSQGGVTYQPTMEIDNEKWSQLQGINRETSYKENHRLPVTWKKPT